MKLTVLITGGSGLVGSSLSMSLKNSVTLLTPSRKEFDITSHETIDAYMQLHKPDIVIHAAAFTDSVKAERERGDKSGLCWKTNVDGSRLIAEGAKLIGAFVVYISTGSVFSGTSDYPGPFTQSDPVTPTSWYGYTKSVAERFMDNGAVIRISHPLCKDKRDYLQKLIHLYDTHTLYPLFTDQLFPITDMMVLSESINRIIEQKQAGIFHVASRDSVSPYELLRYALMVFRGINPALESASFARADKRLSQFSAISSDETMRHLGLAPYSWRDVIDSIYTKV